MRRFARLVAVAGAAAVVVGVSAGSAAASPGASGTPTFPVLKSPIASGYAAVPGPTIAAQSFTHVQATFTVPTVICPGVNGGIAQQRVGLDGISDGTIERVGIGENCQQGAAPYTAWYQMYPAGANFFPFSPGPGDRVRLSVSFAGGVYTFIVTDLTTGKSYSATAACAPATVCENSSAQVTVGLPDLPPPPLLDFGTVHFSGIVVTDSAGHSGGLASPYWGTVKLVQTGHPHSVAGPLNTSSTPPAQAFADRWKP
jgi:hypothetical protein